MSYEILVGLNVLDESMYENYRCAMKPILSEYEGRFCYDFKVSDTLISEHDGEINRVFIINFSCQNKMQAFFSNPEYLAIKEKYFVVSVDNMSVISSYEK